MSEQSNGELKKQIEDLRVQSQESYSSFAQEKQKLVSDAFRCFVIGRGVRISINFGN